MNKFNILAVLAAAAVNASAVSTGTFTANEAGFLVNSHLIMGETEAVLVDAQFTRSQARELSKMVKASKKSLKAIFITHAHPDHYLGLEVLTQDFPKAKVLARQATINEIKATAQGKIDYWKTIYKEDLADKFIVPEAFEGKELSVDSEKIELVDLKPGESETATVLYVPSIKAVITGDMTYGEVHLWLAENRPESWLQNLAEVSTRFDIENVLSGHGQNGDASLLKVNANYISDFVAATQPGTKKESAKAKMVRKYPKYKLPIILDLAIDARLK